MFRTADVVLLKKIDLLPHLDFDVDQFRRHVARVNPLATVLSVSATRGDGLTDWYDWILGRKSLDDQLSELFA